MAKERYPYPPDEFDLADRTNKPVGVHEQPRSTWSKVWPFLLVLIIVPAIAFGLIKFISERSSIETTDGITPAATSTQTSQAAPPSQTPSEAPSETPSETPTPTPTYEVDKSTTVNVYNAVRIAGQARKASDKLKADGFTSVVAADYKGADSQGENTVYYSTEEQSATAAEVASVLGFTEVKLDETEAGGMIAAVIRVAVE